MLKCLLLDLWARTAIIYKQYQCITRVERPISTVSIRWSKPPVTSKTKKKSKKSAADKSWAATRTTKRPQAVSKSSLSSNNHLTSGNRATETNSAWWVKLRTSSWSTWMPKTNRFKLDEPCKSAEQASTLRTLRMLSSIRHLFIRCLKLMEYTITTLPTIISASQPVQWASTVFGSTRVSKKKWHQTYFHQLGQERIPKSTRTKSEYQAIVSILEQPPRIRLFKISKTT